jgi:hypothetical protein
VIDRLEALYSRLVEDADVEVKLDSDDKFGWRMTISYHREIISDEAALAAKYQQTILGVDLCFRPPY